MLRMRMTSKKGTEKIVVKPRSELSLKFLQNSYLAGLQF